MFLGSFETKLKDRFGNHKKTFNHVKHKNDTELSKEFWEIKKRNGTRKIIRICRSYNPSSKRCLLCLNEKFQIATYKGDKPLKLTSNPRNKIPLQCLVLNCNAFTYCFIITLLLILSYIFIYLLTYT